MTSFVLMETRTVYLVNCHPGSTIRPETTSEKLNKIINSITVSDIAREIMPMHLEFAEEDVTDFLNRCEITYAPAKIVVRAAIISVAISTLRAEHAIAVTRAHHRLMLKLAHLEDIDLSISL